MSRHCLPLGADDRGQVVQIGAVVLLAAVVVTFATYQATVVPQQNAAVEFDHAGAVVEGLDHTRASVVGTARTGASEPVTFPLATGYPTRFLAVNPPRASGRIETRPQGNVTVEGAVVLGGVSTNDVLEVGDSVEYRTRALRYRPSYNVYDDGPVVRYGASVLYQRYGEGDDAAYVVVSDQRLVDGADVYLTTLHGRLNTSGSGAVTLEPRPLSAPATPIQVRSTAPDNLTVRVPTRLPEGHWAALLASETGSDGNVTADCTGTTDATPELDPDATTVCEELVLVFDEGTYTLHAAAIGLGPTDAQVDAANYSVAVAGNESYVTEESRQPLVVEVRDRYNNPVSGVTVNATVAGGGGSIVTNGTVTGADGRATVVYEAPAVSADDTTEEVEVAFGGALGDPNGPLLPPGRYSSPKDTRFEVYVQDVDDGSGGPPGQASIHQFAGGSLSAPRFGALVGVPLVHAPAPTDYHSDAPTPTGYHPEAVVAPEPW